MPMALSSPTRRIDSSIESVAMPHGYPGPRMGTTPFLDSDGGEPIRIPAIGLTLRVRLAPGLFDGAASIIETVHAPGFGPPLHRHAET